MSQDMQKSMAFAKRVGQSMAGYSETILASIGDERGFFKDLANQGPGTGMNEEENRGRRGEEE